MKNLIAYLLIAFAILIVIFGVMYVGRLFSNATTPITVHKVEPGVKCATMVTADGAAISCWKIDVGVIGTPRQVVTLDELAK